MEILKNPPRSTPKKAHSLRIDSRTQAFLTGVSNVDSFNDEVIVAYTDYGELILRGKGLTIEQLNVETGELSVRGQIASAAYTDAPAGKGVFSKIFR